MTINMGKKAQRRRRTEPRSINLGRLPSYLGYQIRQTQAAVSRDLMKSMADLKVTPVEYGLLAMIGANPGISQIDLAAAQKVDKSTLSLAVTRLVKRGLIRRARSPHDERACGLFLGNRADDVLKLLQKRVEAQERVMDAELLPGQRELMLDLLQRIARALDR